MDDEMREMQILYRETFNTPPGKRLIKKWFDMTRVSVFNSDPVRMHRDLAVKEFIENIFYEIANPFDENDNRDTTDILTEMMGV